MSSGGSATADSFTGGGYLVAAATAVYCYEYLLTLKAELKYVWGRRVSGGGILFVMNRYAMLAASLASIAQTLPLHPFGSMTYIEPIPGTLYLASSPGCQVTLRLTDICLILVYTTYAAFAALRMYALYGMNKAIFAAVLSAGLLSPCAQLFLMSVEGITTSHLATYGFNGSFALISRKWGGLNCAHQLQGRLAFSNDLMRSSLLALRVHALVFELILIGLTWKKTFPWTQLHIGEFRTPFTTIFLRDGTLYFMIIAAINSLNIGGITSHVNADLSPADVVEGLYFLSPFVDMITSICMSRFLLNLLAAANGNHESEYCSSRWDTIMHFGQVEVLGAQLCEIPEDSFDDEDAAEGSRENDPVTSADEVGLSDWGVSM